MTDQPRLPTGSEFSPGQVKLALLLAFVKEAEGDRPAITGRIGKEFYADADPAKQTARANNVWYGMSGYGLIDSEKARLTEVGERLRLIPDDDSRHAEFARHILRTLHGGIVLNGIRSLKARRTEITKVSLVRELSSLGLLTQQGKPLPENTTDHLILLAWLRRAGVLPERGYEINEAVASELSGITSEGQKEIHRLSQAQRAFLRVLKGLSSVYDTNPVPTKQVKDQCDLQHPGLIPADRLRSDIVNPLQAGGWLVLSGSLSGKSGQVAATPKLLEVDPLFLGATSTGDIPPEVREKLDTPLDQVLQQLESEDTGVKGLALEILAVRMAFELGLTPLRFRERSRETQGAEVDLIAEGMHLHFSRWLFQCKNTKTVPLSALAKEIGMAVLLHAHVIVLVTTGRFAATVKEHADGLAQTTPLQAVLIDGEALARYRANGAGVLVQQMRDTAQAAMTLKRVQLSRSGSD